MNIIVSGLRSVPSSSLEACSEGGAAEGLGAPIASHAELAAARNRNITPGGERTNVVLEKLCCFDDMSKRLKRQIQENEKADLILYLGLGFAGVAQPWFFKELALFFGDRPFPLAWTQGNRLVDGS